MKKLWVVFLSVILFSCASEKKAMDSWLNHTKQQVISAWGPPARIASDGGTGEILVYDTEYYNSYLRITTYKCSMLYCDGNGVVYHWLVQTSQVPPQQMDINLYTH